LRVNREGKAAFRFPGADMLDEKDAAFEACVAHSAYAFER
jgi:hypothetical protein